MPALGIKDVASMQPGGSPCGRKKMATECQGDECQGSNSGHVAAITFTVGEKFNSVEEFYLNWKLTINKLLWNSGGVTQGQLLLLGRE